MGEPKDGGVQPVYRMGDVVGGRYFVVGPLAEGPSRRVYVVRDNASGERLALKTLRPEHATREDLLRRFEREAEAIRTLNHPAIAQFYGHGLGKHGLPYMVTELVKGQKGTDLVMSDPPLTPPEVVDVMGQLCAAIQCAHDAGIIHRNLKWSNVIATSSRRGKLRVKIIDFGVLKVAMRDHPLNSGNPITAMGVVIGTPYYMAPEQVLSKPVDARSDVYSLGVMCYELLTREPPFTDPSSMKVLLKHLTEKATPPHLVGGPHAIPEVMSLAVMRALAKKPDERYSSAAYFHRALEASLQPGDG